MPVQSCQLGGKPGYRWGESGKCYTYESGDPTSRERAQDAATRQGAAIEAYQMAQKTYTDYPKAAREAAETALRWADENGWGSCGTPVGKARANQLAKGEPISVETISRMAGFARHRKNGAGELGEGCGRLMWLAWGGDAGVDWAIRKMEEINREKG